MDSIKKISSYVWYQEDGKRFCFFVSTMERDSSAAVNYPPPRFDETMAWEYNYDTMVRGDIVAHVGDGECFKQHFNVCKALAKYGKYEEPNQDEEEKVQWYVQDDEGKRHGPYDDFEEAKTDADRIDGIIVR